ncbi:hypothetical protein F0A16_08420 [Salinicola corii]|uniref:Twin-arginine translocation signal domain-containing protein n=1 Tax=Salinicola corii TaxID=2606937 RepID=A0A640WGD4_9GAMM|nr:hypothetical protein [Salinicola corii]KAA0019338.1 hypothetical protein F0A16_08420 [Salinicola corii]
MSMTRRQFVIGSLAGGLACCLPVSSSLARDAERQPLSRPMQPTAGPRNEAVAGGIRIAGDASIIVLT